MHRNTQCSCVDQRIFITHFHGDEGVYNYVFIFVTNVGSFPHFHLCLAFTRTRIHTDRSFLIIISLSPSTELSISIYMSIYVYLFISY